MYVGSKAAPGRMSRMILSPSAATEAEQGPSYETTPSNGNAAITAASPRPLPDAEDSAGAALPTKRRFPSSKTERIKFTKFRPLTP